MISGSTGKHDGPAEGDARKEAAFSKLRSHRDWLIRRGRRALVSLALERGRATADDVAEAVGASPDGIDPRWLGAVPGEVAKAGIIRPAGYAKSARPARHASILTVWELADPRAASAWLARHPELPEPECEDGEGEGSTSPPPPPPSLPTLSAKARPILF